MPGLRSALLLPLLALAMLVGASPPADKRPNVVIILADDAALMDFGAYGGEARTPNIDALAGRGALFTQYRASPLCSPSRAMLLTGMDNTSDVDLIAGKLIAELSRTYTNLEGHDLQVTPSMGIAFFPRDGHDIATLCRHADSAMYTAKRAGRGMSNKDKLPSSRLT